MKKKQCKFFQQHLFDYLSDDLKPELKGRMDEHIHSCETCMKILNRFRAMEGAMAIEKQRAPSPFMTTRILQHLENEWRRDKPKPIPILRPMSLAAGVLLAMMIGYGIGKLNLYQSSGLDSNLHAVENLKTDLFIHDFIDESHAIITNE